MLFRHADNKELVTLELLARYQRGIFGIALSIDFCSFSNSCVVFISFYISLLYINSTDERNVSFSE